MNSVKFLSLENDKIKETKDAELAIKEAEIYDLNEKLNTL